MLHGSEVPTVFDLLGRNENHMTRAMGWALSQSPEFLELFVGEVVPKRYQKGEITVALQVWKRLKGWTDVELTSTNKFHLIVEAKKGWQPPQPGQLKKYATRLRNSKAAFKCLIILTDWSYVAMAALPSIQGIPVKWMSWSQVRNIAAHATSDGGLKRRLWLEELIQYLRGVTTMQDLKSNSVFVVSLGSQPQKGWSISFIDIVRKKHLYFHPTEKGGWPKIPPNYLAWRYGGRLQGIAHIKGYKIVPDMNMVIPEIPRGRVKNHVLYYLGPVIQPSREVKVGKLYRNQHVKCMLDTLLTAKTIAAARNETNSRLRRAA